MIAHPSKSEITYEYLGDRSGGRKNDVFDP
jgi:hypothetical protein